MLLYYSYMKKGYVYILTNKYNNVFYVGVTSNIKRRIYEHRNHKLKGFTNKYDVIKVIYIEVFDKITDAITREKQIKGWSRQKKIDLIKTCNSSFDDLYNTIINS